MLTASVPKMSPSPKTIHRAARALAAGELVAMPTETVYGLAADAASDAAVRKIFAAKGRPVDHPLIVHVAGGVDMSGWVNEIPDAARKVITRFWPGPLTLILKKSHRISSVVTGGQDTVGIRCPAHPVAQALLLEFAKLGSGIVAAPSANRFGHVSPTSAQHVRDEFGAAIGESIHLLDGGKCEVGIESTILDLSRDVPVLLRPGAISREALFETIGVMPLSREEDNARTRSKTAAPRVSGALAAHYAPRTPLKLIAAGMLQAAVDEMLDGGKRVAVLAFKAKPKIKPSPVGVGIRNARPLVWIAADVDASAYARDLYAHLRTLDAAGTAVIFVEAPPDASAWDAVNDRLGRAAVGSGKRVP
jgi:L-threonylcarbamoyladenylate synthase